MTSNYRDISYKTEIRIRDKLDAKLRINQAGYLPRRGYIEHVHALKRILEECYSKNIPLVAVFLDCKKAFSSIDRNIMFKILQYYGVPEPIKVPEQHAYYMKALTQRLLFLNETV